jgi:hypothetical protein
MSDQRIEMLHVNLLSASLLEGAPHTPSLDTCATKVLVKIITVNMILE